MRLTIGEPRPLALTCIQGGQRFPTGCAKTRNGGMSSEPGPGQGGSEVPGAGPYTEASGVIS